MKKNINFVVFILIMLIVSSFLVLPSEKVKAGSYDGADLANAVLADLSTLVSSAYWDTDDSGTRQEAVASSLGTMLPTDGSTFMLLGTGIAGAVPVTTNTVDPGDERGTYFSVQNPNPPWTPYDEAELTLQLQVPQYMHYLYYDVQFFTAEYPDYIGTAYNDKLTITVDSPSQGTSVHIIDVNGGDFVLNSHDIPGTGFDVFSIDRDSGNPVNPSSVDWLTRTPSVNGADAGATALVSREHSVFPNEVVTLTINVKDTGDNIFDSTAFIDNVMFCGYEKTEIIARKTVQDLNEGDPEPEDILEYQMTISNIGTADQNNNPGNEFEDYIPENTAYVSDSASASSGSITYDPGENKIIWDGAIPAESSVAINFQVILNAGLPNGLEISNQGTVYWDSSEDGTNDAAELTDDPAVDDSIDQDGDGETNDDDPTIVVVSSFELPSKLTEGFDVDESGGKATESFEENIWFETTEDAEESNFEVASDYYYSSTHQSFKTKLRSSSSTQYWNYSLTQLNSEIAAWEVWFACGNASEPYDLYLDFKNSDGISIAKIKLEYSQEGSEDATDYILKMYYLKPSGGWGILNSNHPGGYFYNGWYKLRLEKNETNNINYTLYQNGVGQVDFSQDGALNALSLSELTSVAWSSTKNPVVCPMFFWDEHKIGITLT